MHVVAGLSSSFSKQHLIISCLGLNVSINLNDTPNVECCLVFIALIALLCYRLCRMENFFEETNPEREYVSTPFS